MNNILDLIGKIPLKGSRTIIAIVLLVLVTLGDLLGVGVDSLDSEVVASIQVVLGGLAGIFYKVK